MSMTARGKSLKTAIVTIVFVTSLPAVAGATPIEADAEFRRIADEVPARVASGRAAAAESHDALARRAALDEAASAIVVAALNAMAAQPERQDAIIAAAIAAAPETGDAVARRLAAVLPDQASAIQAAAARLDPVRVTGATGGQDAARVGNWQLYQLAANTDEDGELDDFDDYLENGGEGQLADPFEPVNRVVFAINDAVDTLIFRPLAGIYGFVTPEPVKDAVSRAFTNFNAPARLVNKLLQGEMEQAGIVAQRFAVNTTVGGLGLFDVADGWGLPAQQADFGETLYKYDVEPGPYVVIPLVGPASARHAAGRGLDSLMHPRVYLLGLPTNAGITGGEGLVLRESLIESLDALRVGSVDWYTTLREAYYQNRLKRLRGELEPGEVDFDDLDTN